MRVVFNLLVLLITGHAFSQSLHDTLDSPVIKRIEGVGNGDWDLELTQSSKNQIFLNNYIENPEYKPDESPVRVSVINDDSLVYGTYQIKIDSVEDYGMWKMYRVGSTDTVYSVDSVGHDNFIFTWMGPGCYNSKFRNICTCIQHDR